MFTTLIDNQTISDSEKMIPQNRLQIFNQGAEPGECVVYWMISARRSTWNHGLQHAIELANQKGLPLVIVEALAIAHQYANDRTHTFVIQGMMDNRKAFEDSPVTYIPYVETRRYEAQGLLEKWMEYADVLVIDDFPVYMPRRIKEIAINIGTCEIHSVDSNGFISLEQNKEFTTAYSLRRHLHKTIIQHMSEFPEPKPLLKAENLPLFPTGKAEQIFKESNTPITPYEFIWRICEIDDIGLDALSVLAIDHTVPPVQHTKGGSKNAQLTWSEFFNSRLDDYSENRKPA